jgi:TRAP-type C4-dicarboxylate transport system substrate-binding protein
VLVLASNDGTDLSGAPAVARFADRVGELSGGRLTVKVAPDWGGGGNEPRVIRDVAAGKADLGWSGTRAFDVVGVNAFQPLHAPFLIDSYAAEAAVVRDPLAEELLGSLRPLGLTGLALLADELRMPAAVAKPLLSPGDFTGLTIGTYSSTIQAEGLAALGARAKVFAIPRPPDTDGLDALDTMWWTYQVNNQYEFVPFVTGNVVLWPRTAVVFAGTHTLDRLAPDARGWLEQAAAQASTWSIEHAGDRQDAEIRQACAGGARIATATPQQLAALRTAGEPVYTRLRTNPTLTHTLDRIQALVESAGSSRSTPIPATCAYHSGEGTHRPPPALALTGPGRPGDLPSGNYRIAFTADELVAHGSSEHDARNNGGVFTWTLRNGTWSYAAKPTDPGDRPGAYTTCAGWYDVQGDAVAFTTTTHYADGDCAPASWSARWAAADDRLTWTAVSVPDFAYVWAGKPWQRIG